MMICMKLPPHLLCVDEAAAKGLILETVNEEDTLTPGGKKEDSLK